MDKPKDAPPGESRAPEPAGSPLSPPASLPPPDFIDRVRELLERAHDFPFMQGRSLAGPGARPDAPVVSELAGQALRRELLAAVESLSPGPGVAFRAPHARLYNLLHLHYVEGLTVQEAAHELSISARQAYRDLRHGEESVAAVLWDRLAALPGPREAGDPRVTSPQAEIARLEPGAQPVDARALVERACAAVDRLARGRRVEIQPALPAGPLTIVTDPAAGPQVLVSLLSQAVQQSAPGALRVELAAEAREAVLSLRFVLQGGAPARPPDELVAGLVDRLGWSISHAHQADGARQVALRIPRGCLTVLIIDDNEGLAELLGRYLTEHACRIQQAASGVEGLRLAREATPDVIVLDVMMPQVDGWQVLQALRNEPATLRTPVIICSVFNDPELAYSLGATLFLPKPVSRDAILDALRRLGLL
jgi:CheY-like chemotaxis protein